MTLGSNNPQQVAAELCEITRSEYRRYSKRTQALSFIDSPFEIFTRSVQRKYGPDGSWDPLLAKRVSTFAHLYMTMAEQHLGGLECMLEAGLSGLALGPSVRSVAEASGRLGWLLDFRLDVDRLGSRQRVARYLLDAEENARIQKRVSYQLGHPDRARFGDAAAAAKRDVRRPGIFYPSEIVVEDRTGSLALCGQALPGPSGFVRFAGRLFGDGPEETSGQYGYISAMTHPTAFAFVETLGPLDEIVPGEGEIPYRRDGAFSLRLAGNAVRLFHNCWRIWASWTATGDQEINVVHDAHRRAMAHFGTSNA